VPERIEILSLRKFFWIGPMVWIGKRCAAWIQCTLFPNQDYGNAEELFAVNGGDKFANRCFSYFLLSSESNAVIERRVRVIFS